MSTQSFNETYNQIINAVEKAQKALPVVTAATEEAAEQKEESLKQAAGKANAEREWAERQLRIIQQQDNKCRSEIERFKISIPSEKNLTLTHPLLDSLRAGLEQAVKDVSNDQVKITEAMTELLEMQINRQSRIIMGVIITIGALIAISFITSNRLEFQREARDAAAEATQAAEATRLAEVKATRIAESARTMILPNGSEVIQVYVPGGTNLMGSDPTQDSAADDDEFPQHKVTLDSFWIDRTEVTNAMYNQCVADGACDASSYTNDPDWNGADHPVVGVSWYDAEAYCAWAGGQLPTEAQWEYAARGNDGRLFPWGNERPTCDLALFDVCAGETVPVGSFSPAGDSWVGAADMAGSVWEWVADWYDGDYYADSPAENPAGPDNGEYKVVRGGSWFYGWSDLRVADRYYRTPSYQNNIVGFRCISAPGG